MSNLQTNPFVLSPTMKAMMREVDGKFGVSYPAKRIRTIKALVGKGLVKYHVQTGSTRLVVSHTQAGSDMAFCGHLDY